MIRASTKTTYCVLLDFIEDFQQVI